MIHDTLHAQAAKAVNSSLTVRNWLIGFYIVEYEQEGEDRASYGSALLKQLEQECRKYQIKGLNERAFRNYRKFYQTYPQIRGLLTAEFSHLPIRGLPTTESITMPSIYTPVSKIMSSLSYTHLECLMSIDEPYKRVFYEIESIKGVWSVVQLKRQINSLYYERSAMSKKPELLAQEIRSKINPVQAQDVIKDVYALEFLGLPTKDAVDESDLETALLDNIEHFLLELGRGFCFEARQKRILIGNEYFFIDLVFYHRILKCHVLIELKVDAFTHGNAGQLNTYLNYFKAEEMEMNDNPPIGILFITDKNKALVEYATADMDKKLFVQKYLIKLPEKALMQELINNEIKKL